MAYTTYNKIILAKSVTEITQLTDGTSTPDMDKVNEAIAKASRKIDGYCSGSVSGWVTGTGITPLPDDISDICTDLAIFELYKLKYGESNSIYEEKGIYIRYKMAIDLLKAIQNKSYIIGAVEKTMPSIQVEEKTQIFSDDLWSTF
jgi:phage gp36-like protein